MPGTPKMRLRWSRFSLKLVKILSEMGAERSDFSKKGQMPFAPLKNDKNKTTQLKLEILGLEHGSSS